MEINSSLMNHQVAEKAYEIYGQEDWVWMDVTDIGSEGNWKYASTGTAITYNNWASGYPSGGISRNCAYIYVNTKLSTHGVWVSHKCSITRRFICEI